MMDLGNDFLLKFLPETLFSYYITQWKVGGKLSDTFVFWDHTSIYTYYFVCIYIYYYICFIFLCHFQSLADWLGRWPFSSRGKGTSLSFTATRCHQLMPWLVDNDV